MSKYVLPVNSLGDATPDKVIIGETFTSYLGVYQHGTYDPDWAIKELW